MAFYSTFIGTVEDVSCLLFCCPSDHRGADPGEGLRAALPPGCLSQPVAWRLPQHEEDREPPAPLCGAGRRQGQDPPPPAGTVSAAASPTLRLIKRRRNEEEYGVCLPSNFPVLKSFFERKAATSPHLCSSLVIL